LDVQLDGRVLPPPTIVFRNAQTNAAAPSQVDAQKGMGDWRTGGAFIGAAQNVHYTIINIAQGQIPQPMMQLRARSCYCITCAGILWRLS